MRRYSPVPFNEVNVEGSFWRERLDTVLTRTIPSQYRQLERTRPARIAEGAAAASAAAHPARAGTTSPPRSSGIPTSASGSRRRAMRSPTAATRRSRPQIDEITDWLAEAQLPDGYLNCWYIGREIENRWTNLRDNHELYCAGHMLEGAIAYFLATGRRRLLDIMEKYVDHIATVFGPGPDQKHGYPGHQEIELALIKLYHLTGDKPAPRPRGLFHQRARQASRTISTRRPRRAARARRTSGRRPTSTTSRTSRCASRTRPSATRSARCTCTRRWPTSPPTSTTRR